MTPHQILIIGVGSIGERHLRCMKLTNRATVGLVEVNPTLRAEITKRYEIADSFASLEDALKHKWNAAIVATPARLHIPMAQQLADLGIHLFIEKPLSLTTDGIDRLTQTVASHKLVARVAYPYHTHPALVAMRRELHSGRFGRPVQVNAISGQHFPTFRPAYRTIYFNDRAKGGGAIQDAITHQFNAVEWLVGPIQRLTADASHQLLDGVNVEDTVHVTARHAGTMGGTVMSSFAFNMYQMHNETIFTVNCERGTLRFELIDARWKWMDTVNGEWHVENFGPMERDDWFVFQENAFLDALEGKSSPCCTLEEGLQTLRVNLAALRSADAGGAPVQI